MPKTSLRPLAGTFDALPPKARLKAEIQLLAQCSGDTVYRLRYDTMQYDYISPNVLQLLGYTVGELMQINMRKLILETRLIEDSIKVVDSYSGLEENRKRGEVSKWQADYLMKTRDGRQIWVSDISHPWFDENGAIIGSMGSLRDITGRIQAEQKIREELLRFTSADTLTGLANRQMFWSRLENEAKRVKRTNGDLSLLLIDIDQFHKVNEAYGSDVGDAVLVGIADLMQGALREIDLAGRLSGEEFGIILPETSSEGAVKVAQRIRDAVARHMFFAGSHNKPVGCTVSIGVAGSRFGKIIDATGLYKLADMRLYIAKHTVGSHISIDDMGGNLH